MRLVYVFNSVILNAKVYKIEKHIGSLVGLEPPSLTSETWRLNQKSYFSMRHMFVFISLILNIKVYKIEQIIVSVVGLEPPSLTSESWRLNQKSVCV